MSNGQLRDFEDSVLDGTIKVPHESFDKLIAMVRDQLRQGAPNVAWAIDGVAEGQELPANVEAALRAYFDAPTMDDADELAMAEQRREAFDPIDPADMEDELRERSENIDNAREEAFERGQDDFEPAGNRDEMAARYYTHPKLQRDYKDGWDTQAQVFIQEANA